MKRYAAIEAETKFIRRNEEYIFHIHEGNFILLQSSIEIWRINFIVVLCYVFLYGYETWFLAVREIRREQGDEEYIWM
jgi:hypothetical protein